MCRRCAQSATRRCHTCGTRIWINEEHYGRTSMTSAQNPSPRLYRGALHRRIYCLDCSAGMVECEMCHAWVFKLFKTKSREGTTREGCYSCLGIGQDGDWGSSPRHLCYHFDVRGEGSFYGVELETDHYNRRSNAIADLHSLQLDLAEEPVFWLKPDGSLSNGIEICFHPRTVKNWSTFLIDGMYPEMKKIIELHGGKSFNTDTAGLHIHREDIGMTSSLRGKLVLFLSQCKPELQKIAQRKSGGYCSYGRYRATTVAEGKQYTGGRDALTLQSGHGTTEFRIFRGTLAPKTMLGQLAFTDLLLEWLNERKIPHLDKLAQYKGALWESFMLYAHRSNHVAIEYVHELLTRKRFYTLATQKRELPSDITLPTLSSVTFDGSSVQTL